MINESLLNTTLQYGTQNPTEAVILKVSDLCVQYDSYMSLVPLLFFLYVTIDVLLKFTEKTEGLTYYMRTAWRIMQFVILYVMGILAFWKLGVL